jgi:hypothetical protein
MLLALQLLGSVRGAGDGSAFGQALAGNLVGDTQ